MSRLVYCDLSNTLLPLLNGPLLLLYLVFLCSYPGAGLLVALVPGFDCGFVFGRLSLCLFFQAFLSFRLTHSFLFFLGCSGVGAGLYHVCLPAVPLFVCLFTKKGLLNIFERELLFLQVLSNFQFFLFFFLHQEFGTDCLGPVSGALFAHDTGSHEGKGPKGDMDKFQTVTAFPPSSFPIRHESGGKWR